MTIANKMKGILAKTTVALAATLFCMLSVCEVASAYNYYDGERSNFTTYGQTSNSATTSESVEITIPYKVTEVVSRKTATSHTVDINYAKSYGSNHTGWFYLDEEGEYLPFDMNAGPCGSIPSGWSMRVGSNGVLYYQCTGCGYPSAYMVDLVQYGYYDKFGVLIYTGFEGYGYCAGCNAIIHARETNGYELGSIAGGYITGSEPSGHWQGIYVYPQLYNNYGKYVITADANYRGLATNTSLKKYWGVLSSKKYVTYKDANASGSIWREESYIDGSQNGFFIRYTKGAKLRASSGTQAFYELPSRVNPYEYDKGYSYGIKITAPMSNNAIPAVGQHTYRKYHDYINFSFWSYSNAGLCIHAEEGENNFSPVYYNGKTLGKGGYGFTNKFGRCGRDYEKGYIGICADCGEACSYLFYASPETISSIRRVENGVQYMHFCPDSVGNMKIGNETFYYLHSQIENEWSFYHACYAVAKNNYTLQFETNSPNKSLFPDTTFKQDGYFYNLYKDGEDIPYVKEGSVLAYGEKEPLITSRNTINNPPWDSKGYMFKNWEVYNSTSGKWVALDTTPTWKEVVAAIGGESSSQLAKDGNVIRLRATWTTPMGTLVVVDGDEIKNGKTVTTAAVVHTEEVLYQNTTVLAVLGEKDGVVNYKYNDSSSIVISNKKDMPASTETKASFSNFESYNQNKGVFDTSTRTYLNTCSTNGNKDYIIGNYSWNTITLPTPTSKNAVFAGWYSDAALTKYVGAGGGPYTPSSANVTLYGKWMPDDMVISAEVTNHITGESKVSWNYNNAASNIGYYYKIYRAGTENATSKTLLTNGTSNGSVVTEINLGVAKTNASSSTTIKTEGIYTITLQGAAGQGFTENGTTASGGKGATYTVTVYLKQNDVLNWYIANGTTNGFTGANNANTVGSSATKFGNKDGYGGNGGAASVLVLTRDGQTKTIAVAGGGGGAILLKTKDGYKAINGGDAKTTGALTANGSKTPYTSYSYYNTNGYNTIVSGGGGGHFNGASGLLIAKKHAHTHSGTLLSGTDGTENAVYSKSGGCYTKEIAGYYTISLQTDSWTSIAGDWAAAPVKAQYYSYYDVFGVKHTKYTGAFGAGFYSPESKSHNSVNLYVNKVNGDIVPNRDETCCTCSNSSCTHLSNTYKYVYIKNPNCGTAGDYGTLEISAGRYYDELTSNGGSCWYDETVVIAATYSADNASTVGSFKMDAKVVGVTSKTEMTDYNTDDKIGPTAPTTGKDVGFYTEIDETGTVAKVKFYMSNINWGAALDRGTPYFFSGQTHDLPSANSGSDASNTLRASTKKDAGVVVTSGVKYYLWEIRDAKNTGNIVISGSTPNLYIANQYVAECNYNVNFNKTYYLYVTAVDKAGNAGATLEIPVTMTYTTSSTSEHKAGVLNDPVVSIGSGEGIYNAGNNTYYVKADGRTQFALTGSATLKPIFKSRITQLTIGTNYNIGYNVTTQLLHHSKDYTNYGGSIGNFVESGDVTTLTIKNGETSVTQNFTTTSEASQKVSVFAKADCLGLEDKGCANARHKYAKQGNTITVIGDKTAPTLKIDGKSFSGEFSNTIEYDWGIHKVVFDLIDNGSGLKSVKAVDNLKGYVMFDVTYDERKTLEQGVFIETPIEGESNWEVTIEDNVGNVTVVNIILKKDEGKPTITDVTSTITDDDIWNKVPPSSTKKGEWPSTNVDALWEYDWVPDDFTITYVADDKISGIDSFKLYSSNSNWEKRDLLKSGEEYEGTIHKIEYTVTTEGSTRYILEAIDVRGNKTTVYIITRIDRNLPSVVSLDCDVKDNILDEMTIEQANNAVNGTGGSLDMLTYTWTIRWKDKKTTATTTDTSGLASSTLYIYDKENPTIAKQYPMINASEQAISYNGYTNQKASDYFPSELVDENGAKRLRYGDVTFTVKVNTFVDFPDSADLGWRIVGVDNVGNSFSKEGGTIKNYAVKAVAYATKNDGYNILSSDGKTNLPYFKTGEVGYVEVWTIGYVDKLELDFGSVNVKVPTTAKDEIARGALLSKYKLGSATFAEADRRYVTSIVAHKSGNALPDRKGLPYATHYDYSFDDVNKSLGSSNVSGWLSDGTMIRIPPSYQLSPKMDGNKQMTDKYGNTLYNWETHAIKVLAYKGTCNTSSTCHYVIWDEAGDDLHYRITHENLIGGQ